MWRGAWSLGAVLAVWAGSASAAEPAAAEPERAAGHGIVRPRLLEAVEPVYPAGARGDASVDLTVTISEDGRVSEVVVRSGTPPFDDAARAAVAGWRFSPALRDNVPVRARVALRVSFVEPRLALPPAAQAQQLVPAEPAAALAAPPPPAQPPPVQIVVEGERSQSLGAIHVPRGDARLIPGAFADPFRVVEILPGVAPVLSGLPYFFVRGAPPGDVGYFIDGIRVPLLFHVGAGPSVIAPALVDSVELVPSAYPAKFGRFAGGIMAGETTAPSSVGRAEAQARVFDAGAMVEAPFAEGRGSALMAGRYSYTQALLALVAPDYELGYWDYQARLAYAPSDHDRFTIFGFGAFDHLGNRDLGQTLFDVQFHRLDLRWDRRSDSGRARLALTLGADERLNADEGDPSPNGSSETRQIGLRFEGSQRLSEGVELRGGLDGMLERYGDELERRGQLGLTYPARTDANVGLWSDVSLRPRRGFEVVPGLRLDVSRSRGENHVFPEPRLATRVRLIPKLSWLSGFGLTHQLPAYRVYVPGGNAGALEVGVQRAYQATQGMEAALPESMYARATLFYSLIQTRELGVSGRNYGLELFLRRDFAQRLGGFLSYTLSRTERRADSLTTLSSFDRPHVLSAVLGYDLGRGFRLGGRAYFASGRRYTVACPTPDCGPGEEDAMQLRPYVHEGRVPGFFRLDLRLEKRWRFGSGTFIAVTAEWFNALLSAEPNEKYWDAQRGGLVTDSQSPLTLPSIGVEAGY